MSELPYILFCESPYEPGKIDPDYEEEFLSARKNGFETLLFNFEDLTSKDRQQFATKKIKPSETFKKVIYRGWMLTPQEYSILYNILIAKKYNLLNSTEEYQNCHYLPDSLKFIEKHTPKTIFRKLENADSINLLIDEAKTFGGNPVIIKDYVKSEKHDWEKACYVPDASDTENLKQKILNLISLRDKYLNEGIVIREFVKLNDFAIHSKSGMPLTEEYRLFFCNKNLIDTYDYWNEGEYKFNKPDTLQFHDIAQQVESNFFSMDIARVENGNFIIIELGDGQVAGLPEKADKDEFYNKLKSCF